jgi:hypothetical protein
MTHTIIRKATLADAPAIFSLKEKLPLRSDGDKTSKGGFLLGTTLEKYVEYINDAYCLVAENRDEIIGFGIIIPDEMLRDTEMWQKRNLVDWKVNISAYEPMKLSYFEQFAFLPGNRRIAVRLAYNLVKKTFDSGAEALFTTTVHKPVKNLAAVPFIYSADGVFAGNIDEYYPIVGQINSDIYVMDRTAFANALVKHPLLPFFTQSPLVEI